MNALVMLFALLCAATAQAILPSWTLVGNARPPILLGVGLYYAMTRDREGMVLAALLAGLLQDALSMIPLGYSSCLFVGGALLVARFKELVFVYRVVTHLVLGALSSAAVALGLAGLLMLNGQVDLTLRLFGSQLVGSLLVGALTVPVVFHLMEWMDARLGTLEAARP